MVLNRNEYNLKVLANFGRAVSLCHGDLIVQCGDDDISLPDRVEKTVDAWLGAGRDRVKLIHCSADRINRGGKVLRYPVRNRNAFNSLGAVAAYSSDVFGSFPPPVIPNAYEDGVWAFRAVVLGEELTLPDRLVKYRIGAGASNAVHHYREAMIKSFHRVLACCRQQHIDLERCKNQLPGNRWNELMTRSGELRKTVTRTLTLLEGNAMRERFQCRTRLGWKWFRLVCSGHIGNLLTPIYEMLCIMPKALGTPLLNAYAWLVVECLGHPPH